MTFDPMGNRVRTKGAILADSGIAEITFDVIENETHKASVKVTDHPVEEGANVSDHAVIQPDTLELVARVSNTPIVTPEESFILNPARAEAAYSDLLKIKRGRESCSVVTTLRAYESMLVTGVSVTRNASTGDVVALTVSLQEIRTATSETVAAPVPKVARGSASVDQGKKSTTPASAATDEKSKTIMLQGEEAFVSLVEKLGQ